MSIRNLARTAFVMGVLVTLYQALTRRRGPSLPTGRNDVGGPIVG